jgi:hypothetical protein
MQLACINQRRLPIMQRWAALLHPGEMPRVESFAMPLAHDKAQLEVECGYNTCLSAFGSVMHRFIHTNCVQGGVPGKCENRGHDGLGIG